MGYNCLVCNFNELEDPPYDTRGFGSFEICVCCGFHYGYDDKGDNRNPQLLEKWRVNWIENGCKWFSKSTPAPCNWNLTEQLKNRF